MDRKKILVVDDDDSLRTALQKILQKAGYRVVTASGADAALELLGSMEIQVDLILSDYRMPEKNGLTFAQEVLERFPEGYPPVIVMTAFGDAASYVTAMNLAIVQEYINKPIGRAELLVMIDSVLRGHGRRSRAL